MKIFVAVSFHGFGHLAQVAPLVNTLFARHPDWQLVLQCAAGRELLQHWITPDFIHVQVATDPGIPMHNALRVDAAETWRQYRLDNARNQDDVAGLQKLLALHRPDLVLSNIGYRVARAASQLSIPCFHFCSLNWADSFYPYCAGQADAAAIYQALCDDYNQAEVFFRLPPYMPMPGLKNRVDVGPVCRVGRKLDLHAHFGHEPDVRHVLVTMGGMPYPLPFERWPQRSDLFFIHAGVPTAPRADLINLADCGISHLDLVASCAVILTKPGYGTFMEAACSGTPVLYVSRGDWPEQPPLLVWRRQHGYCREITETHFQQGDFVDDIEQAVVAARSAQYAERVSPTGIDEIIARIELQLGKSGGDT